MRGSKGGGTVLLIEYLSLRIIPKIMVAEETIFSI